MKASRYLSVLLSLAAAGRAEAQAQDSREALAAAKAEVAALREGMVASKDACYYNITGGKRAPLDHADKLAARLAPFEAEIQAYLDKPSADPEAARRVGRELSALRFVCWEWPALTEIGKRTLPPSFDHVPLRSPVEA